MMLFAPAVCLLDDNYYNEIDPYAAQWLRNLIAADHIAPGAVDERSIADVHPDDLKGFTQCHFFAGIGGWSLALRLAGWPDDRAVWTGSCPCQPFSVSGKQEGFNDPRHLWPELKRLVAKRSPAVIFGEQSAAAAPWLALVRGDLETLGYAMGAIPMEAASAGADHFRDRYWFVADYDNAEWRTDDTGGDKPVGQEAGREQSASDFAERRIGDLANRDLDRGETRLARPHPWDEGIAGELNDTSYQGLFVEHASRFGWGKGWAEHEFRSRGLTATVASFRGKQFLECPDGKWRALPPPGVRWLGDGIPARVDKLRGLGNAIDPRPAAEFITAYMRAAA